MPRACRARTMPQAAFHDPPLLSAHACSCAMVCRRGYTLLNGTAATCESQMVRTWFEPEPSRLNRLMVVQPGSGSGSGSEPESSDLNQTEPLQH